MSKHTPRTGAGSITRILDALSSVAVIGAALAVLLLVFNAPASVRTVPEPTVPAVPVSIDGAPLEGDPTASVVLIEFADFQCPFCAQYASTVLPELRKRYVEPGKLQVAFRNLPISSIHPMAERAAVTAVCAHEQEQFWQIHKRLFALPSLTEQALAEVASSLDVDRTAFDRCTASETVRERVSRDRDEALSLGVRSTPTFLIGTRRPDGDVQVAEVVRGAVGVGEFVASVDRVLEGSEPGL